MIKSSSFFFFFKGGLICRHYIEGLYYTALLLFFFCSSFTAQQSNASVSFCVYVCVSARSCLSFCDIRRFPRFCSKWFTNGDKLTSVFFFCTCRRLGMNCTALLHERKEGTKNEVRAPSSVLKRQWSSSVLHDGYEMIEAAYSLFSFFFFNNRNCAIYFFHNGQTLFLFLFSISVLIFFPSPQTHSQCSFEGPVFFGNWQR